MDTETRPERRLIAPKPRRLARWLVRALLAVAAAAVALVILFVASRVVLHHTLTATKWDAINLGR